jgi:hypothetical protein
VFALPDPPEVDVAADSAFPRAILISLLVLGAAAPAARAAWPSDPTINLPVCTAVSDQMNPRIVSDAAGGAILTWQDTRGGTTSDIYAQRVNFAGVPQWAAGGVALCTATGDQITPVIVADGAGGAIVSWEDFRVVGQGSSIYAQRVNAAGVAQWSANGVALSTTTNSRYNPTIATDGANGAIVAWQYATPGPSYDIHVQRVTAAGAIAPGWPADGLGLSSAANDRLNPAIIADGAGGAIVAWQIGATIATNDVVAQRVNAGGALQWGANGAVVSAASNAQYSPLVATDGAGGAIMVWQDTRNSTFDLYAQHLNAAGTPQWTTDGVAVCPGLHGQQYPALAADDAGGVIVAWDDARNGTADVFVQRLGTAGTPLWASGGAALCVAAGHQQYASITPDLSGGAIVTWQDERGTGPDVYARRVSSAGVPQWGPDGVAISTASIYQVSPILASNGEGGAIVAWQDSRNLNGWDVYAQNVNGDGSLGGSLLSVPGAPTPRRLDVRCRRGNPGPGALTVSFSLVDGSPARLDVFDVVGRRVSSLDVGSFGAGDHVTSLAANARELPPGLYEIRLAQGAQRASTRAVVLR